MSHAQPRRGLEFSDGLAKTRLSWLDLASLQLRHLCVHTFGRLGLGLDKPAKRPDCWDHWSLLRIDDALQVDGPYATKSMDT
jgi:hypothetical protein